VGVNDNVVSTGLTEDRTTAFTFGTSGLLTNDTDVDSGDTRTVSAVVATSAKGGAVSLSGTTISYVVPDTAFDYLAAGATTTDTITYTVRDAGGLTDTATATVTITGVNDAAKAVADNVVSTGLTEDRTTLFTFDTSALLANDTDIDGAETALTVSAVAATSAKGGAVTISGTTISYDVPNGAFQGLGAGETATDTITYTLRDSAGATSTGTATLTITGVNDKPTISSVTWLTGFAGGVIPENAVLNAPVAIVNVSDPDDVKGSHTFTVADPGLKVVWNATAARYELRINNGFDYEAQPGAEPGLGPNVARSTTITPNDGSGGAAGFTFAFSVSDQDQLIGSVHGETFASGYYETFWNPMQGDYWAIMKDVNGNGGGPYGAPGLFSPDEVVANGANGSQYAATGYYFVGTQLYYEAPIVLDLDGNGVDLIHLNASNVFFDQGADGSLNRTGWVGAADGLLVLDRNHNGKVDNAAEISFVGDKAGAKTDLEGLAGFDSNADGLLDSRDARFAEFQVWQDANQDGVSQASELKSLAAAGMVAIELTGQSTGQTQQNNRDNVIFNMTSFIRADGTKGQVGDVALAYEAAVPTGGGTPTTPQLPAIGFAERELPGKRKHFAITAAGGSLYLHDKRSEGEVDPRSALLGPASLLTFKNKTYGLFDPIILDLDQDGVETRSIKKAKARFDMNGDGALDDAGWAGKGDGFLVIDRNGDGRIGGPAELSFLTEGSGSRSSLEALAALDSNRDGKLDSSDSRFAELSVWRDADGDGVTDQGELAKLGDHGITSIGLSARPTSQTAKVGENLITATATFTRTDGSVGTLADAALAFRPGRGGAAPLAAAELDQLDRRLEALREGANEFPLVRREGGLALRNGADPFTHFAGASSVSPVGGEALTPPSATAAAISDPRLALIAQDMAAFGTRRGEGARDRLETAVPRFDYHAG
jgi:VCBS repeat-containing protein